MMDFGSAGFHRGMWRQVLFWSKRPEEPLPTFRANRPAFSEGRWLPQTDASIKRWFRNFGGAHMDFGDQKQWIVLIQKSPRGPFTETEVNQLIDEGVVRTTDLGFQFDPQNPKTN